MSTLILYLTMGIMLFFVNYLGSSLELFIEVLCAICSLTLVFAWIMYCIKYVDMFRHPDRYRN